MHEPHDLRPSLIPRTRARLGMAAGLAAIFAAGVVTAIALRPAARTTIRVSQPSLPAPVNQTTVLPFAVPSIVVMPAAPAPVPEPAIVQPPPPRATKPIIDVACIDGVTQDVPSTACGWHDGFPAISGDGALIAQKVIPDDGGRGYPGLTIQITDARTSKPVRSYVLLSPDEHVEGSDPDGGPPERWAPNVKLRKKVARRVVAAQRVLDAGNYRPMTPLGTSENAESELPIDPLTGEYVQPGPPVPPIRAEFEGDAARIIESAGNTVLWQRRFPVAAEFPPEKHDWEQEGCYATNTRAIVLAFDEMTRTVLASVSYASGPCYCGDDVIDYAFRL